MCYNCGCQMPDNDMGKGHAGAEMQGKSITNKTMREASRSMGQPEDEAKKNVLNLLEKVLGKRPSRITKVDGYDRYEDVSSG